MVFGVLLLAGTIRSTFDELIDSRLGQDRPDRHGRGQRHACPQDTLDRVKARPRRRRRRRAWSAACSRGSSPTAARSRAPRAAADRRLRDERATSPTTSASSRDAGGSRRASRSMVEQNWAQRPRLRRRRPRPASPAPTGRTRAADRRHLQAHEQRSTSAGSGTRRCRSRRARQLFDQPRGLDADLDRRADDRGDVAALKRQRQARARQRRRRADAGRVLGRRSPSSSQASTWSSTSSRASRCSSAAS